MYGYCPFVVIPMAFHKSPLGANMQLYLSCVSAPPATNVDLFACFAERLLNHPQLAIDHAGA